MKNKQIVEEEKALIQIQNTSVTVNRINNIVETTNKLLKNDDRELIEWWKGLDEVWQFLFYINISKDAFDPNKELYIIRSNFYNGIKDLNYKKILFEIKSLTPLKLNEMINLETFKIAFLYTANVNFQILKSFSPLEKLKKLKYLLVQDLKKIDLNSIRNLNNITDLEIRGCDVVDLEPISKMYNLVRLDLESNSIDDITGLSNLTNITSLNLRSNKITNLSPLSTLTKLTNLDLFRNHIIDGQAVKNLSRNVKGFYFDISIYEQLIQENYFRDIFQKKLEEERRNQKYLEDLYFSYPDY
jgi:Leucine-rich repeat (LRR) protein